MFLTDQRTFWAILEGYARGGGDGGESSQQQDNQEVKTIYIPIGASLVPVQVKVVPSGQGVIAGLSFEEVAADIRNGGVGFSEVSPIKIRV